MPDLITGVVKKTTKGSFILCDPARSFRSVGREVVVPAPLMHRCGLVEGADVCGTTRIDRGRALLETVESVCGLTVEAFKARTPYQELTAVSPHQRFNLDTCGELSMRIVDLVAPMGKGTRGLIVSPPKAGKTTVLKDIAAAITANDPDVYLMCLLVDERPEEVTDMERSIHGEVISSTFDMPSEQHIQVAELTIERAKRLVESGRDVVILLDSITRLARAYNLASPASGRILSGGVDSTALYPPKKFFGAARNI